MTDLSPAAEAVLDAVHKATQDPRWQTNFYSSYAAAALRAAADQAADLQIPWSYTGESYQIYDEGLHAAAGRLRAIAAELEAKP
jgi:hypothetical protein